MSSFSHKKRTSGFNMLLIHYFLHHLGNLYFSNVKMSDSLDDGFNYVCIAANQVIRGLVQGDDQVVRPYKVSGNFASDL